ASAMQEPPRWTLSAEPVVKIGVVEGDPRYQLFDAVSSALLDDGRIAVLNAGSHELRFYGADGRFLAAVGRKGGGPGEFAAPGRLYRVGRDSLMIYDRGNTRFSIHTLDGTFVRTEPAVHNRLFAYDEWLYNRHWIDGPALGRGRAPVRAASDRRPRHVDRLRHRHTPDRAHHDSTEVRDPRDRPRLPARRGPRRARCRVHPALPHTRRGTRTRTHARSRERNARRRRSALARRPAGSPRAAAHRDEGPRHLAGDPLLGGRLVHGRPPTVRPVGAAARRHHPHRQSDSRRLDRRHDR